MQFDVQPLVEVDLHVTNRCSLRCTHCCFESGTLAMEEMTVAEMQKLLDELSCLGIREVHITGGEPLVRNSILAILDSATNRGFHVRLQTNGVHLNPKLVQTLKQSGVNSIMISVDGYGVDHETIRGVGTFRRTMDGVACAKAGGLFVRVNSVVHRDNMAGMLRLLEETCGMRVDVHSFFYYTPHGRGVHTTLKEVPGPIWLAFLESLKHHWTKIGVPVGTQVVAEQAFVAQNAWNPMLHGCKIASPDYAQIMCDGRVVPCTMFIVTPYSLGNVRQHSLEEVWSSQEHWKTFESIRTAGHGDSAAFEPTGCWAYLAGQNRPAARDPRWQIAQGTVPICPIVKCNVILGTTGPSTEDVISRSANRSEGPSGKS